MSRLECGGIHRRLRSGKRDGEKSEERQKKGRKRAPRRSCNLARLGFSPANQAIFNSHLPRLFCLCGSLVSVRFPCE